MEDALTTEDTETTEQISVDITARHPNYISSSLCPLCSLWFGLVGTRNSCPLSFAIHPQKLRKAHPDLLDLLRDGAIAILNDNFFLDQGLGNHSIVGNHPN